MADWINWLILAGLLVIFELFTGTFYVLMVAIGMGCGAIAALMGAPVPLQVIIAGAIAAAATLLLRRSRLSDDIKLDPARDPNVNIDIGQAIKVDQWQGEKARVMYRGALWDVELAAGSVAQAGSYKIAEVRGARLVVANA
ncbi:MAG: NfeD family protein [Pseudomonadota bacterium]